MYSEQIKVKLKKLSSTDLEKLKDKWKNVVLKERCKIFNSNVKFKC